MDEDRSPGSPPLSGLIAGQYEVERALGAGGMGVVYLARDTRLKRRVAIKTILGDPAADSTLRERFVRETRVASRINHPFVATVYDVVEHEGRLLLVMEHIAGRSLNEVLGGERPSRLDVLRWLTEIAEALTAIHREGVVHRDVKPGNVMITDAGHVKVMDFGLARHDVAVQPEATTVTGDGWQTNTGTTLGTLMYMSPEQLRGESVDARSDQFSFGILAWEALTGRHPFARTSTAEAISAILNEEPEVRASPPVAVPTPEIQAVVLRALRKDPADRFTTSVELSDALKIAADLRSGEQGLRRGPSVLRVATVLLLTLAVLAVAGIWWLNQPPTWQGERFVVVVAPFQYPADDPGAQTEAGMITDLLTRDLQASYLIRAEGPEQMSLAGLSPMRSLNDLGLKIAAARDTDYVVLGTLARVGRRWVATAQIKPAREGRDEPPPLEVSGDGALALAEGLAAGVRRRLPDVSRLTAMRDDRVDLAAVTSRDPAALAAYERGARALREDRVVEAVAAFEEALRADSEFALAQARLAEALFEAGYGRRARAAADRALELAPQKAKRIEQQRLKLTIQSVRGRLFSDNEQWIAAMDELSRQFPNEPALMLDHTRALAADQQFDEALLLLDRALQVDSRNPALRRERAAVLIGLERYEDALKALASVRALFEFLESEEGLAGVERARARIALERDEYREAIAGYTRAADRYSAAGREITAAEVRLDAQSAHLQQGDWTGATAGIEGALRIGREAGNLKLQVLALTAQGVLWHYREEWDRAIQSYLQSADLGRQLENDVWLAEPLANASGLLVWLRRFDEAAPILDELLLVVDRLDRRDVAISTLTTRADLAVQTGALDEADTLYDQLLGLRTDRPEAIFLSGIMACAALHRERGRLGEALALLDEAIALARTLERPMDVGRALQNRARVYSALGRVALAEADMAELATIMTDYPNLASAARLMRMAMDFHRGDWIAVRRADADRPGHASANGTILHCGAEVQLGRDEQAVATCSSALTIEGISSTELAEGKAWLALALTRTGRYPEATIAAREAFVEAERMGLLIAQARAAAALAAIPEDARPADAPPVIAAGRAALATSVEHAPDADRAAYRARPDLAFLQAALDAG